MTREIVAWTYQDDLETIPITEDEDEAMGAWYDQTDPADPIPATVTLYGWARMEWDDDPSELAFRFLERFRDSHEEMFDPDDSVDWPADVRCAANALAAALLAMEPWACEVVETKKIDAAEWIAKNHPEDAP